MAAEEPTPKPSTEAPTQPQYAAKLRGMKDHPKQLYLVRSKFKRKIVKAGRRGGKTTGAATLAVEEFCRMRRVLYAAPTADQVKKFWYEVKRALAPLIDQDVLYKNETEHIIERPGSEQRIRAKTAWNADTLRGDYADVLILDEWQLMDESAWEDVGAPMLIDNNGDALFIYTPRSLHSKSVSKARDPRHAAKMFEKANADTSGRWLALHFTSHDNPHLSREGLEEITHDMTRASIRREILAEDTNEVPGSLWKQEMIDRLRVVEVPEIVRIVVGIDPSGSSTNEAGIVAAGLGADGNGYVLRDGSLLAPSPRNWAGAAVALYHELKADRVLAESNYGGDMVAATIRAVDDTVSYKDVTATRGKLVRAEPICALYEQGMVHHVGDFPELEDEMCGYFPGDRSPNRMDALVWALTELFPGNQALGYIDYLKSGAAEADMRRLEKSAEATSLSKPVTNDQTRHCPECQATIVRPVAGGQLRCNQCGHQWWPGGRAPATAQGKSRAEYLADFDARFPRTR